MSYWDEHLSAELQIKKSGDSSPKLRRPNASTATSPRRGAGSPPRGGGGSGSSPTHTDSHPSAGTSTGGGAAAAGAAAAQQPRAAGGGAGSAGTIHVTAYAEAVQVPEGAAGARRPVSGLAGLQGGASGAGCKKAHVRELCDAACSLAALHAALLPPPGTCM